MLFISILATRNPVIRNKFAGAQTEVFKRLAEMMVANPKIWNNQLEKMRESGKDIPEDISYEEMKEFIEEERYEIKYREGYHATLEFHGVDAVLPYMWDRGWTSCVSHKDVGYFICSDRPVALKSTKPGVEHLGFGMKYTDVTIPLSKTLAISGKFEQKENSILKATQPLISAFNGHTYEMADRQIYAPNEDFWFINSKGRKKHSSTLLQ